MRSPISPPRTALYDLADSLATLMDEMQGEGVTPEVIAALDVSNHSAHWTRTQSFMQIVQPFFGTDDAPDSEARQRRVVEALAARWQAAPPQGPIIVAGSTASRGTTLRFMQAVAALPQGALILPGFDFDLPGAVWDGMGDAMTAEDHPQYRFRRLLDQLGHGHADVTHWSGRPAPCPARNRLVSLSLRPAPVTDQWLTEGQHLTDLAEATAAMTLIEADSPRQARQLLREKQWAPLEVKQAKSKEDVSRGGFSFGRGLSARDLALVTRQLATLVQAALPIEEALRAAAERGELSARRSALAGWQSAPAWR